MYIEGIVTQIKDNLYVCVITLLGIAVFVSVIITFFITRYIVGNMSTNQDQHNPEKNSPVAAPDGSKSAQPQGGSSTLPITALAQPAVPDSPVTKEPLIAIAFTIRKTDQKMSDSDCNKKIQERVRTFRTPFPQAGLPFQCSFDFSKIEGIALIDEKGVKVCRPRMYYLEFPNMEFSLQCDNDVLTLSGTSNKGYDGKLHFIWHTVEQACTKYVHDSEKQQYDGYHNYRASIPFLISRSIRDSLKDLPVDWDQWDEKVRYKNECKVATGEELTMVAGNIEVVAASVRGRSHADVAKPRDDAFHFVFDRDTGWNFVAVADGGGTYKYSRKGSELACKTVIEEIQKYLTPEYNTKYLIHEKNESLNRWRENASNPVTDVIKTSNLEKIFQNAIRAAVTAINEEAKCKGAKIDDYNTTLLCAAFKYLEEYKKWLIVSYWIGDGGAAIIKRSDAIPSDCDATVLGKPDSGKYAGQVKFLTAKDEVIDDAIL